MFEFKSAEDLSKLSPDDPAFPIVEDLVKRLITDYIAEGWDYRPEDDGYTILIQEGDVDRDLDTRPSQGLDDKFYHSGAVR